MGQNLQSFLIGSKAMLEFDTALSEAHALEDKEDQFAALLAIVERLGRN